MCTNIDCMRRDMFIHCYKANTFDTFVCRHIHIHIVMYTTVTTCIHVHMQSVACISFKTISFPCMCKYRCSCNCWCLSDDLQCAHIIMPFSCYFCREESWICWPSQNNFSRGNDPFSKSSDLSTLVEQILVVFQNCSADPLLEKWTKIALSVGLYTCTL